MPLKKETNKSYIEETKSSKIEFVVTESSPNCKQISNPQKKRRRTTATGQPPNDIGQLVGALEKLALAPINMDTNSRKHDI